MALFDDASLVVTPNGYKEGTLYSIKPTSGLGDMTVVRATTATRVNSAGLIELVPYNLLTYSEQFDNAAWGILNSASVSANTTIAPNGTTTADTLTFSANASSSIYQAITTVSELTFSVYAKVASGTKDFRLRFDRPSPIESANFTVTTTWQRFTFTASTTGSGNVYIINDNLGTAGSIFIWGAQLNIGSTAKDYLRTETRLNIPRLDYSNGSCPSLLVEPQRTNLALYSEQFNNAAWQNNGPWITPNTTTAPDGTLTADTLAASQAQNNWQAINASINTTYTLSLYVKLGTATNLCLIVNNQSAWNTIGGQSFNSANGLNTSTWTRISYTFTTPSTLPFGGINFHIGGNAETGLTQSTGTVFIWGAQLELGSYPTSYIPTTSAAVTRNADRVYKTGISALIGQTEGVMFCDFVCVNNSSYCDVMAIGTDGTTGVMELQINGAASNTLRATYFYGGFVANIPALATLTIGQRYKAAFAYKTNDFVFYLNGVQQGTDTSGTVVSGMSEVSLNGYNSSTANKENALINSAILFPTRLTNAELISLTTL